MREKGIYQEELKLLACVTMLVDHIGAVLVPGFALRIIGRIAFPIFCFVLAEGAYHTRDPRKYGIRLLIGLLLSELPFDLLFSGRLDWGSQSVMVTLLLGFIFAMGARAVEKPGKKYVLLIILALLAELFRTDYGAMGVVIVAIFVMTREHPKRKWIQLLSIGLAFWLMDSVPIPIGRVLIPIQMFGLLGLIPIFLYNGKKRWQYPLLKGGFYLFYPAHMIVLYFLAEI